MKINLEESKEETIGKLLPVNRNYLKLNDWVETNDGILYKVKKLEYREVYTDKGVIKKTDIRQVYEK